MPFLTSHDIALSESEFPRTLKVESQYGSFDIKRIKLGFLDRIAHADELRICPSGGTAFEMVNKSKIHPEYINRVCWMANLADEQNGNHCSHSVLHTPGSPLYTLAHAIEHLVANDLDERGFVTPKDNSEATFCYGCGRTWGESKILDKGKGSS